MPTHASTQETLATLYCWNLPELVVVAFGRLAAAVGWEVKSAETLPSAGTPGVWALCAPMASADELRDVPPDHLLLLCDPDNIKPDPPAQNTILTLTLPMRAEDFQQTLVRLGMSREVRGRGLLANYRLAVVRKTLCRDDLKTEVLLTDREVDLLRFLLEFEDGARRGEILATVWGYCAEVETQTLETHVSRLRSKLARIALGLQVREGRYILAPLAMASGQGS
ncbi:MAG: winged helix-turn-helix domain-containing protein [Alphaproteobacteria bacterium]|nr:winged helix-turn-helix domain-containing protein [Alphaproteobacteria bacterium]